MTQTPIDGVLETMTLEERRQDALAAWRADLHNAQARDTYLRLDEALRPRPGKEKR